MKLMSWAENIIKFIPTIRISQVIFVVLVLLIIFIVLKRGNAANAMKGQPAPVFALELLGGGMLDLQEHLGKRPVVLDFWAVWCPPCRTMLPRVSKAFKEYQDKGVAVYSVNLGDAPESITAFLEEKSLDLPVALDADKTVAGLYGVRSIPTMMFINREGIVSDVHTGGMSQSSLNAAIDRLLE